MATRYLRSTDGSDLDDASTWALAKATIGGASGIGSVDTAGDTIWVSQVHAESTGTAFAYTSAGTLTSPIKLLCGNDAAEPPTSLTTGATITCTASSGASTITNSVYAYGIKFQYGASLQLLAGNAVCCQYFDNCTFDFTGVGSSSFLSTALDNVSSRAVLVNCSFKFANAANYIQLGQNFEIRGGSALLGTSTPNPLFKLPTDRTSIRATIEGVDFSNFASTLVLCSGAGIPSGRVVFRDCKLPASWSGTLVSAAPPIGQRIEMYNCSASSTNYALWIEEYSGTIRHETTIVKTSGATDGTTALAWKMTSTANSLYPYNPLVSGELVKWNDTTGSSVTATIDIVHDSVTNLKDDEVWIDVQYLGSSSAPNTTLITDAKTDYLTTAADQTASSATWTTTGLTNPNKQKLSVTFTPQLKGFIIAKVMLAKASKTIYVDPLLQVA